jgi:ACS family hexuronate transporter-like MFS transporter
MSLTTVIPWLLGFIAIAGGGFVSDWIFRATGKLLFSRKIVLSTCLAAAALCVALAGIMSSLVGAVTLMSTSIFFLYLTGSIYWAIIQDTVRGESVGGVGGFVHFLANISGIIGPAVTGIIVQTTGSYYAAFALAGGIVIAGAIGVALFVSAPKATVCIEPKLT